MPHDHLCPRLSLLAALLLILPTLCVAQIASLPEGQSPTPQPTGSCRITGQVVAADNGAPVKGAGVLLSGMATAAAGADGRTVTATGSVQNVPAGVAAGGSGGASGFGQYPPGYVRKMAETDQAGRFEFTDLPAGRFSIMTSPRSGFVPAQASQQVQLIDRQAMAVTIRLQRTGAIVGRVLDEAGEPLSRAQVRAVRRDAFSGNLTSGGAGANATTDDLGQFRLYDLQPGDYFVVGTGSSPPSLGIGPRTGYGPTYYPGAPKVGDARRVPVRSGQDTSGIEFALQRVALGRISGVVTDFTGRPVSPGSGIGISVTLSRRGAEYDGVSRAAIVRPEGRFVINDIAPGDYYLSAVIARGQGPDAEREGAFIPVTVNGDDMTVNIQTNTGATIFGRVVVEGLQQISVGAPGGTIVAPIPPRVMIRIWPDRENVVPGAYASGRPSQAGEDGTFQLTGARGGSFYFAATAGRAILKSVSRGGEDITTKPMKLTGTERITDIVIVLTTDTGRVPGNRDRRPRRARTRHGHHHVPRRTRPVVHRFAVHLSHPELQRSGVVWRGATGRGCRTCRVCDDSFARGRAVLIGLHAGAWPVHVPARPSRPVLHRGPRHRQCGVHHRLGTARAVASDRHRHRGDGRGANHCAAARGTWRELSQSSCGPSRLAGVSATRTRIPLDVLKGRNPCE